MPHTSRFIALCVISSIFVSTSQVIAQSNTILIIADDVGTDAVSAYKEGAAPPPTPNIDALAKSGVLFRNAYANPICSPTRATIFTGRYSCRTGVGAALFLNRRQPLPTSEYTIAEILKEHDYSTGLIGKWHLTDSNSGGNDGPNLHGWSHFSGHLSNITGPDTYFSWNKVVNGTAKTSKVYTTTDNVDDAISWISMQKQPWLCCVSFLAAHAPFHAPPKTLHTYDLDGKSIWAHMPLYFKSAVQAMDTEIGRLFKTLGPSVMANTNVIFLGDNGTPQTATEAPFVPSHAKQSLYEGGVNVPLIISGPAVVKGGREVTGLVASVDLFSTILDLSGVAPRSVIPRSIPIDGVSLLPYLQNTTTKSLRDTVYVERFGSNSPRDGAAVRNDRYKLIRFASHDELYDLKSDPFEKNDLLAATLSPTSKIALKALQREFDRIIADSMPFGDACAGRSGTPRLELVDDELPRLGRAFRLRVAGLDNSVTVAIGYTGVSKTVDGKYPLPIDLTPAGMPGCTMYVSLTKATLLSVKGGAALWQMSVPNRSDFLGAVFYQQAYVRERQANARGTIATHAIESVVGAQ